MLSAGNARPKLTLLRTLNLAKPSAPGRPLHIAAASGLVAAHGHFYVVADDELHLGVFSRANFSPVRLMRLFDGQLPESVTERKKAKPDLEALVGLPKNIAGRRGDCLLAVPSGSKKNRGIGALAELDIKGDLIGSVVPIDFSKLYKALENKHGVRDLNIEGAIVVAGSLRLLQRGNAKNAANAVIDLDLSMVADALMAGLPIPSASVMSVYSYDIGAIGGVRLSFTDGTALSNDRMLFVAAAEATESSYDDAPCVGSVLGVLCGKPGMLGKIEVILTLDQVVKVEGVYAEEREGELKIFMVTDADDPERPALLYETNLLLGV